MDDTEDDARYPPNPYGVNHPQGHGSSHRPKLPLRNASYHRRIGNEYVDEDDEEELGHEEDEDVDQSDAHGQIGKEEEDEDEDDEEDNNDNGEDEDHDNRKDHTGVEEISLERHQKKRKLKSLISSYEFAPRLAVPLAVAAAAPKPFSGGRNSLTDWTEHETFVLLDAWGDRFLQLGRKSLRSEEWQEVAEKVSQESRTERTDTQCRNRLDTLKKKYKKEKIKSGETGGGSSKWVYFKKMDMLMSAAPTPRQAGLSCGLDSGVFMDNRTYLNRTNGLDEMKDSPGNSGSSGGEEDNHDSDGLPPKRKSYGQDNNEGSSFRLLANSIQKFSEIYQKIESRKRQQMVELEKMRMDFHRDLEMQKRQIIERAQAEITKLRQQGDDDEEKEVSAENVNGPEKTNPIQLYSFHTHMARASKKCFM